MVKRIAVDIGNSRIACGLFDGGRLVSKWYHDVGASSQAADRLADTSRNVHASTVAISSVVTAARDDVVDKLAREGINSLQISENGQSAISNTYPTLGSDRLANATAVLLLYLAGSQSEAGIALDFGTATTLTAVDRSGKLLGGMITLGLQETMKAIYSSTDQLPLLNLDNRLSPHNLNPLSVTTEDAIRNGTVLGHLAIAQRWIDAAKQHINRPTVVIATGGISHFLSLALADLNLVDHVDPDLTLKGINLIAAAAEDPEDRD